VIESPTDCLVAYENEVLVPLVKETGVEPIREEVDFPMVPGALAILMNKARKASYVDQRLYWDPLSVLYSDPQGSFGSVYDLRASYDPRMERVRFERATMTNIVDLVRVGDDVAWIDPHTGQRLITYPLGESDKVLMNSWYLFATGILPLLINETYRFVPEDEKVAFKATMIHHISSLYRELI